MTLPQGMMILNFLLRAVWPLAANLNLKPPVYSANADFCLNQAKDSL